MTTDDVYEVKNEAEAKRFLTAMAASAARQTFESGVLAAKFNLGEYYEKAFETAIQEIMKEEMLKAFQKFTEHLIDEALTDENGNIKE